MALDVELVALVLITLFAAVVNGALGHGFSSITVPIALLLSVFWRKRRASGGAGIRWRQETAFRK